LAPLVLSAQERSALQRWAKRPSTAQALALRCRIVLACAEGVSNSQVARRLGVARSTVTKWRARFVADRLDGLLDEPRPGAPRTISDEQVERVLVLTLETTPKDATHWSTRSLARQLGMSQSAISRIWRAFGLKPHLVDTFKLSTDPQFIEKVRDIVGLYLNPPEAALVLCVDEKTQVQALDRTAPILPLLPGTPQRATHDYVRHGTTNLYAALDVASGKVISQMTARHRAIEFKRFLDRVTRQVPAGLDVHVICDNSSTHKTPAIQRCWSAIPRAPALHPDPQLLAGSGGALGCRADQQMAAPWQPPFGRRTHRIHPVVGRHLEQGAAAICMDQDRRRDPRHHRRLLPPHQRLRTLAVLR
jgi:transposase